MSTQYETLIEEPVTVNEQGEVLRGRETSNSTQVGSSGPTSQGETYLEDGQDPERNSENQESSHPGASMATLQASTRSSVQQDPTSGVWGSLENPPQRIDRNVSTNPSNPRRGTPSGDGFAPDVNQFPSLREVHASPNLGTRVDRRADPTNQAILEACRSSMEIH